MSENVALVDMDGTVCKYHEALELGLRRLFGKDRHKVSKDTVMKAGYLIRSQPGWYANLEPIPFGIWMVGQLKRMGFSIMVLTKGNPYAKNAWSEKADWCGRHLKGAKITITEDKGLVYGKVLVDDWPPYVTRWLAHRPRGIVLMPSRRWNKEFSPGSLPVFRMHGRISFDRVRPLLAARLKG